VYDASDIVVDPQLAALGAIAAVADEDLGTVRMPSVVARLSETPGRIDRAGAAHGADTAEVLARTGVSPEELKRLRDKGVV